MTPREQAEIKARAYANLFVTIPRKDLAPWQEEIAQHYIAGFLAARDEAEALVRALEYYAETDNWPYATKGHCPGEKAREALKAWREERK